MTTTGHRGKPAIRMQSAGGRGAFQCMWEAIRQRRHDFTVFDIHSDTEVMIGTIQHYLHCLQRGGYVARINADRPRREQAHYQLLKDAGIEYPRLNSRGQPIKRDLCTEAMWRTMRILGEFSSKELAEMASTPDNAISHSTASTYLTHLQSAGYVCPTQQAAARNGGTRYRFEAHRYTGPRPPVVGRQAYVYDPNEDKVVWQQEINHADL